MIAPKFPSSWPKASCSDTKTRVYRRRKEEARAGRTFADRGTLFLELQKRSNISRQQMARRLGVDPKTLRSRLEDISGART